MVAGSSAAATDQPGPAVELDSSPQAEIWEGEYTCPQGITALTLRITRREGTTMEAVFSFRASEKNPGVPSGAFTLVGNMRADRSFELTPSQWIDRPDRYVMVGMAGELDAEGTTMRGRITEAVCGGFELRRAR